MKACKKFAAVVMAVLAGVLLVNLFLTVAPEVQEADGIPRIICYFKYLP